MYVLPNGLKEWEPNSDPAQQRWENGLTQRRKDAEGKGLTTNKKSGTNGREDGKEKEGEFREVIGQGRSLASVSLASVASFVLTY